MGGAYGADGEPGPAVRPPRSPTDADADATTVRVLRDPDLIRLEGVHAVKHAVRFGAELVALATPDLRRAAALLHELAPDVTLPATTREVGPAAWRALVPRDLPSPLLGAARRPDVTVADLLRAVGPVVVLEQPRHLGNLGAAIRVAAAADAAGVLVVGDADPWHPTAVRSAAGLQFALPVVRVDDLPDPGGRPVVALAPDGAVLAGPLPADALLLVGTERGGLSPALRARATRAVRLPMREGVSSLNLATAVAAALYRGR